MRLFITDKKLDHNGKPIHSQLRRHTTYKNSMSLEDCKQHGDNLLHNMDHKAGINYREMKITDDTGKQLYKKGIELI